MSKLCVCKTLTDRMMRKYETPPVPNVKRLCCQNLVRLMVQQQREEGVRIVE